MKTKTLSLVIAALLLVGGAAITYSEFSPTAKCTGSKTCTACKNCKSCKYCAKEKGTCGICK